MDFKFLNIVEAKRIITKRDEFIQSLSPFDKAARLKTENSISEGEFLNFISRQTLDWGSFECSNVDSILESILLKIEQYPLEFPKKISLIKKCFIHLFYSSICCLA